MNLAADQETESTHRTSRRGLLRSAFGLAAGAAALTVLPRADAWARSGLPHTRALSFRSLHTGEVLKTTYIKGGAFDPLELAKINWILRDWRSGESARMDPDLLDLLFALRDRLESDGTFEIISGYRSPRTNAALAAKNGGVAKRSLHMKGQAIDIRLANRRLDSLHKTALALRAGGVGYYSRSGFVHLDTGRVRRWGS
jgi:uncharacterized protein YcbK (DUF882 family)